MTSQTSTTTNQQDIQHELDALFRLDDEDAGELLLVRHAEPASSPPDPMLSCDGLRQAERLTDRLSSLWIDTIYSSPERRCFQTAKVDRRSATAPPQNPRRANGDRLRPGEGSRCTRHLHGALQPATTVGRATRLRFWQGLPAPCRHRDRRHHRGPSVKARCDCYAQQHHQQLPEYGAVHSPRSVLRAGPCVDLSPATSRRPVRSAVTERHGTPGSLEPDSARTGSFYAAFIAVNKSLNSPS